MNRYKITASMRQRGALGISMIQSVEVDASNPAEALQKVYETHEHVHLPHFEYLAQPRGVSQIDVVQHDDTNTEPTMAKDDKRKNLTDSDPAGAGPVSDATADTTADETVEKPYGPGKEFATEREYVQARVAQARKEQQAHLNQPKEGTPGGAPSVEALPGAAEDRAGHGKPIGSGESWSSPDTIP